MEIKLSDKAVKQYQALPKVLQQKADKQFEYLVTDIRYPSLDIKKYKGTDDLWQGRIDKGYRFYFYIIAPNYIVISIINHEK
jgi:mRNA-degrading endonuclease RelE of RelBE toxin-antitoxin system